MVTVRDDYDQFVQAGGGVVAVTMGTVRQTAAFKARHELPFACLADPNRELYRAFHITRGNLMQVAGPSVWLPGLKSVARAGIGAPVGDIRQLQASFLVDTSGVVRLAHYPANSSEYRPNDEVIELIKKLAKPTDV